MGQGAAGSAHVPEGCGTPSLAPTLFPDTQNAGKWRNDPGQCIPCVNGTLCTALCAERGSLGDICLSNDPDWLLCRGIEFKALMALGSNYFQQLIEAYVFPCSLCSAEDDPLPALHWFLQDLSWGSCQALCLCPCAASSQSKQDLLWSQVPLQNHPVWYLSIYLFI